MSSLGTALRLISGLGLDQEDALFHPAEERNTLRCLQRDIIKGVICLDTYVEGPPRIRYYEESS